MKAENQYQAMLDETGMSASFKPNGSGKPGRIRNKDAF